MATEPEVIRVSLVGPPKSGKTTLVARIVCKPLVQTISAPESASSESESFAVKKVAITESLNVTFDICDIHGDPERFKARIMASDVIVVVFDLTSRKSYDVVTSIVQVIRSANSRVKVVLVGNKCEMRLDRIIELVEVKILAGDLDVPYIEISAIQNIHVREMLHLIALTAPRPL
ncbi:hypothetical protein CAPTEDRAFT_214651 [Capitella teleta]|uniref:small monomeric GTPase n=1 Tax=Capitella teleta TaxID=283909 RepID=R7UGD9_CAPTE|nr:hypothetical protein CAPTEDRAFT_214651 [Capitella teleta]|eukprot:ELU05148.1 hypothetical protein CAPTEDRAFT_214651 [Capitella teleta]